MTFFHKKPFILLVGEEGAVLLPPNGQAPLFWDAGDINADKEIHKALRTHPFRPVILLADTQAQEIRVEPIPPLRPMDRQALLKRRLQQKFPASSLKKALTLGEENEKAVFLALHESPALTAWKERLANASNPSRKTALLPFEAAHHLLSLIPDGAKGWAFFMIEMHTGGWRQVITFRGQPVFTRQSPLLPANAKEADISLTLKNDLVALLGYLPRLGLGPCENISGLVLTSTKVSLTLKDDDLNLGRTLFITAEEAAEKLGLKNPSKVALFPDLFIALACQHKGVALMLRAQKHFNEASRKIALAYLFKGVAAAVWTFALIYCLLTAERPLSSLIERRHLLQEIESQQTIQRSLLRNDSLAQVDEQTRDALIRKRLFKRPTTTPWPFLQELTRTMGSDLTLATLYWQLDESGAPEEKIRVTVRPQTPDAPKTIIEKRTVLFLRLQQEIDKFGFGKKASVELTPCDNVPLCEPEISFVLKGEQP